MISFCLIRNRKNSFSLFWVIFQTWNFFGHLVTMCLPKRSAAPSIQDVMRALRFIFIDPSRNFLIFAHCRCYHFTSVWWAEIKGLRADSTGCPDRKCSCLKNHQTFITRPIFKSLLLASTERTKLFSQT